MAAMLQGNKSRISSSQQKCKIFATQQKKKNPSQKSGDRKFESRETNLYDWF
jgi:hypothetical protein